MLKKTLFAAASAIAVVASGSLPASAVVCPAGQIPDPNSEFGACIDAPRARVPEPSSILGITLVGGFIGKKVFDAKKASK